MVEPGSFALSFVGKRVLDRTLESYQRSVLRRRNLRISSGATALSDHALSHLLNEISTWSAHLEYQADSQAPTFEKIYIELDCFLDPVSDLGEANNPRKRLSKVISSLSQPLVLLGRPGYGKTTTLKSLCSDIIHGSSPIPGIFPIPLLIRLREKDPSVSLFDAVLNMLHIGFEDSKGEQVKLANVDSALKSTLVSNIINEHQMFVALDGFDEIPGSSDEDGRLNGAKARFLADFRKLCLANKTGQIVLTSRTADFPYRIEGVLTYEIGPLSASQVRKFVSKYFLDKRQAEQATNLIIEQKMLGSEFIPLTLTYMCMIYSRFGRLFHSRREMYSRILDLLLDDWDLSRGIRRPSAFIEFDSYDKRRFLKQLAFTLGSSYTGGFVFSGRRRFVSLQRHVRRL